MNKISAPATLNIPPTQSIKYAGSKLKLLPHILSLIAKVKPQTIFDGFSGTTRVSQALAQSGYRVISNDISAWSQMLGICYLQNKKSSTYYAPLIAHLNNLPARDGWFTAHYGGEKNTKIKRPFQIHNTRKLDAIRDEIEHLKLPLAEKAVALTSLMLALDEVDNTLGHYAAYLREWSARSHKNLSLKIPQLFHNEKKHQIYRYDIFNLLPKINVDLAYFDPPYGSNNAKMPPSRVRYAAYYHLWTTICLHDQPAVFGKANRRVDSADKIAYSPFEDFRKNDNEQFIAVVAIEKLIRQTNAQYILLSYSSGGRATANELNEVLRNNGELLDVLEIDYQRNVMAKMRWTNEWINQREKRNREFLFLLRKW